MRWFITYEQAPRLTHRAKPKPLYKVKNPLKNRAPWQSAIDRQGACFFQSMYFCPYRADLDVPIYPGRCPGLCSCCPFRAYLYKLVLNITYLFVNKFLGILLALPFFFRNFARILRPYKGLLCSFVTMGARNGRVLYDAMFGLI